MPSTLKCIISENILKSQKCLTSFCFCVSSGEVDLETLDLPNHDRRILERLQVATQQIMWQGYLKAGPFFKIEKSSLVKSGLAFWNRHYQNLLLKSNLVEAGTRTSSRRTGKGTSFYDVTQYKIIWETLLQLSIIWIVIDEFDSKNSHA